MADIKNIAQKTAKEEFEEKAKAAISVGITKEELIKIVENMEGSEDKK